MDDDVFVEELIPPLDDGLYVVDEPFDQAVRKPRLSGRNPVIGLALSADRAVIAFNDHIFGTGGRDFFKFSTMSSCSDGSSLRFSLWVSLSCKESSRSFANPLRSSSTAGEYPHSLSMGSGDGTISSLLLPWALRHRSSRKPELSSSSNALLKSSSGSRKGSISKSSKLAVSRSSSKAPSSPDSIPPRTLSSSTSICGRACKTHSLENSSLLHTGFEFSVSSRNVESICKL
mmetsp:Transcript_121990/g.191420  ORF Transcript_121990/g.191420 Transcript_121990/m.191420 type:complete len:231 (-) Transcript_121990:581-1273(-)